jgi:alkylhydroperoxidase/carboxymuconolactone decarboxylase family protein YurZ
MLNTYNAPDIAQISGSGPEALQEFVDARRAHGLNVDRGWGLMYQSTADSIMLDHRPDYARSFYEGLRAFRTRLEQTQTENDNAVQLTITSFQHLPMYILYGWETGIYNEFRHLQSRGLSKAQLMELVMFAQLQAGMRGLQHVSNAVGRYLPDWSDGPGQVPLPAGWAADPEAFRAGLDLSVRGLNAADRAAITAWYERTIGSVPNSVMFAMAHHPEFYKWHRARWEIIFQKLPKQTAPYVMIRQHMLTGNHAALREAVQLGKAWGITREWLVHGFIVTAYYTGFEALSRAYAVVEDLLDG